MTFEEALAMRDSLNNAELEEMDSMLADPTYIFEPDMDSAPEWWFLTPGLES